MGNSQKEPTSTWPKLKGVPWLKATIMLMATTVPGSAQGTITRASSSLRPRNAPLTTR